MLISFIIFTASFSSEYQNEKKKKKVEKSSLQLTPHTGKVSTGATLVDAQVIGGTLDTVKTFSGPQLISLVEHGDEWAYLDNDGERLRLDGRVLIK